MTLLSEAAAASIRRDLAILYVHTYTRTPRTRTSADAYDDGSRDWVPGTPVVGVKCKYDPLATMSVDISTRTTINTPTLTVAHDDPTTVGHLVSDIRDSSGAVLLAGPLEVEVDAPSADFGPVLERVLTLRGGQVRRL